MSLQAFHVLRRKQVAVVKENPFALSLELEMALRRECPVVGLLVTADCHQLDGG
jgi:hypothetical protein